MKGGERRGGDERRGVLGTRLSKEFFFCLSSVSDRALGKVFFPFFSFPSFFAECSRSEHSAKKNYFFLLFLF